MKRASSSITQVTKTMKKVSTGNFFPPPCLDLKKLEKNELLKDYNGEKIKISSWNVNGIRAVLRKKNLEQYFKQTDLDLICFNETKIDKKKFEKGKLEE